MTTKPKLTIELVPKSSWYDNVRSNVSKSTWDRIRKLVYLKANYVCEICGEKGKRHPVECHEVWEYDLNTCTQKLIRLIALCPDCHSVKHIGRAYACGGYHAALRHLCKVNNWSKATANKYVHQQFAVWSLYSQFEWDVDTDALKQYNQVGKVESW
jgi:hypothetical protein